MEANQLQLWFAAMAYVPVSSLRRIGLQKTDMAAATCGTIRCKMFKIGALVTVLYGLSGGISCQNTAAARTRRIRPTRARVRISRQQPIGSATLGGPIKGPVRGLIC
jgi:hypothetical protein